MKGRSFFRNLLIITLLIVNIGCDQLTKNMVRHRVIPNEEIRVIDHIVTLTRVENTGAFLSFGDKIPRPLYRFLMIILPLLVLCFLIYYLIRNKQVSNLSLVGICLIAGGGLGNIIDRIAYGSVTDFLYFNFGLFHTGIVNMADISITAGFLLLIVEMVFRRKPQTTV